MWDMAASFLIGLFGSLHCMGMCGPLVLAYSLHLKTRTEPGKSADTRADFFHHLAFHSGRLVTYGLLGGAAAALFNQEGFSRLFSNLRGGVTLASGVLMILIGGVLMKVVPLPGFFAVPSAGTAKLWGRLFHSLLRSRRIGSKIALGLATGFLPCGLSWAMIAKAATAQQIAGGFLSLIAFGLGTVPLLFTTGFSASFVSLKIRVLGERAAAASVMVMGLILVFKAVRALTLKGFFAH